MHQMSIAALIQKRAASAPSGTKGAEGQVVTVDVPG